VKEINSDTGAAVKKRSERETATWRVFYGRNKSIILATMHCVDWKQSEHSSSPSPTKINENCCQQSCTFRLQYAPNRLSAGASPRPHWGSLQRSPGPLAVISGPTWRRRGAVVSGVRRMNEVNARRARLVPGWVTVFGRIYHLGICNQPTRSTPGSLNRVPALLG